MLGEPGTFPAKDDFLLYRVDASLNDATAGNLKIGRILSVAIDRSTFTIQRYGGFTQVKGSTIKRTDMHPENCRYRAVVTDKGEQSLKAPLKEGNPETATRKRTRRQLSHTEEPVKAQIPIGNVRLAFRNLAANEMLVKTVRNFLRSELKT